MGSERSDGVRDAQPISEDHCRKVMGALRSVQEMWDMLHRFKLNPALMREYSNAISVLEEDLKARLPKDTSGVNHLSSASSDAVTRNGEPR